MVRSDHKSIVKFYKEDLCTISGPLGRRGSRHEFLNCFNGLIEYIPGNDNADGETLSGWAYRAGAKQDTNSMGLMRMPWDGRSLSVKGKQNRRTF